MTPVKPSGKRHPNYVEYPGYPSWFNPHTSKHEPIHRKLTPRVSKYSSKGYPGWVCKSCSAQYPENHPNSRCNNSRGDFVCRGPLIRYMGYEDKAYVDKLKEK